MPNYRRNRIQGATSFFTANLRDRRSGLLVAQIEALRAAVRAVRRQSPFDIDAWVVLPDHMHCLWTLPESDSEFPDRRASATRHRLVPATISPTRFGEGYFAGRDDSQSGPGCHSWCMP